MSFQENKDEWESKAREAPLRSIACDLGTDENTFWSSGEVIARALLDALGLAETAGMKLLDFGCGVGRLDGLFARDFAEVTGVDISSEMIARAKIHHSEEKKLIFMTTDEGLTTIRSSYFDVAVSYKVFQHLPKATTKSYVTLLRRKIRDGGWFIFQIPDARSLKLSRFVGMRFWLTVGARIAKYHSFGVSNSDFNTLRFFHPAEIRQLLRSSGFSNVSMSNEIVQIGSSHRDTGSLIVIAQALGCKPSEKDSSF